MNISLNPHEIRVLGSLIEKGLTTPDYYPMSLNAITAACNQKSNRDPVMNLSERTVQETVDRLIKKHLISQRSSSGSRVAKYAHRFSDTLSKEFNFSKQELATICVLLLRGPQTAGEIRSRTGRMCSFDSLDQVDATIKGLMNRDDGPYVMELPRQAGRRESRFMHLLGGEESVSEFELEAKTQREEPAVGEDERITQLQEQVDALRDELEELKTQFIEFKNAAMGVSQD